MQDRACVRGLMRRPPIEIVGKDGFERAIGARPDIDGMGTGCLQTLRPIGTGEPHDAEAGAEALFGMRALSENDITERRGRRSDAR